MMNIISVLSSLKTKRLIEANKLMIFFFFLLTIIIIAAFLPMLPG